MASAQKTFFVRIHPAHPTFLRTMTPAEEDAMNRHFAYWKQRMGEHRLILAGPVPIDPGTFGILIVRAKDFRDAEALVAVDPSIKAHVNDYEIYPYVLSLYEAAQRAGAKLHYEKRTSIAAFFSSRCLRNVRFGSDLRFSRYSAK